LSKIPPRDFFRQKRETMFFTRSPLLAPIGGWFTSGE
jgi:hypothetical protein